MFAARGRLITESFALDILPSLPGVAEPPPSIRRALEAWARDCDERLGPASTVRAIADVALVPLLHILQLEVTARSDAGGESVLQARAGGSTLVVVVTPWSEPLPRSWRRGVLAAAAADAGWCLCSNGRALRFVDARRTWSRDHLEIDVPAIAADAGAQWLLWSVARADSLTLTPPLLDRIVELSRRHGVEVCRALGNGVLAALKLLVGSIARRTRRDPRVLFEQSLTVLYRMLFLLFAEARGLLPVWHPVYRDRYSLETIVTDLAAGRPARGLWQTVRAISRLAHAGCAAGELRVTAFNGRLFAPGHAAAFEETPVPDGVMNAALSAVSTTESRNRRRARIAYRDLDVEQLGAVYEQVLDYEPAREGASINLRRTGDARKSTATFYTPRAVTAFVVRRTLQPLVQGRTAAGILALRVLDPAMGSGAFLVAACRFLASAAEDALIREGEWHPHEITPADRGRLRREIASRCLFGVDLNPMAVQLARLSLWLATLAGDRPLSFFDHHLVCGDSLVGATPEDVVRSSHAPGRRGARARPGALPLFGDDTIEAALEDAVRVRLRLTNEPDDTPAAVRSKERTLAALQGQRSSLGRWSRVLDLWCAGWFWENGPPPDRRTFAELAAHILHGRSSLPERVLAPLAAHLEDVASRRAFLHWPIAFPEVLSDERRGTGAGSGFDAIVGNPPWDMVRGDSGEAGVRAGRRADAQRLTRFVRESGIYRVETRAHVNRYQLFVERALQLARPGGRIGLVLPSGVASDAGAGALRRHLFDRADIDEVTGIDNREGIFPIHRGLRFALVTCTRRQGAREHDRPVRCRFGVTRAEDLERDDAGAALLLTRGLLSRLSGDDDLGIPELSGEHALRLVERICATVPRLAAADGWQARFGRELNASDDRGSFTAITPGADARPVVEGKLIEPFRVSLDRCRLQLRRDAPASRTVPRRVRLAYRDVASATNRLTLIAALVPARAVTTHTLFCLKTPLPPAAQHLLCALLNSFVANYLVRLRVSTHVTLSLISRLPVPLVPAAEPAFDRLAVLAATLMRSRTPVETMAEHAELQALCARLYGLDAGDFAHVLGTFPLIPAEAREAAMRAFERL